MNIAAAYKCNIGRVRQQNDDFVWSDAALGVFIVADGMGGLEAGDVASRMTADTVSSMLAVAFNSAPTPHTEAEIFELMIEAIETANRTVFAAAQTGESKRRMGTTIVAAVVQPDQVYISHAGDSRAYLARGANLTQLTEDDSWGAQFAAVGGGANPQKGRFDHFLTKSVGQEWQLDPSFIKLQPQPNDWLILCSDGLWNMVDNQRMLAILNQSEQTPQQAVDALVDAANAAGGKDNISVVVVKFLP